MLYLFAYFAIDKVILSLVINMRRNKVIKSRIYFILAVLLLTAACIVVYTSMRAIRVKEPGDTRSFDSTKKETSVSQDDAGNLQQVSSVPGPQNTGQVHTGNGVSDSLESDIQPPEEITYCLTVTDGFLQVYIVQTDTLYMETDIIFDLLPAKVQAQIKDGKYFDSEEALLQFLENYSS